MQSLLAKLKRLVIPAPVTPVKPVAESTEASIMPNIITSIEHGLEVAAVDVLKVVPFLKNAINIAQKAEPQVIAALGVLAGAAAKAFTATASAAAEPTNFTLDAEAVAALKPIWPDVVAFLGTLGVKF